jgi:hypothetical protein
MPQCVGLSCRFSGRAGRVHAGFTESTRAASYLVPSGRVHESGRCQAVPTHRLCAPPVLTHDHPGGIGREKMPSVENAVGRVQGSGPPHYSGIRFGLRFRVPIRSHPINIAESPEYGRPPPVGWSPNRVRSGRLPIRSHPINPIRSSPAGGVRELHGSGRCTLPFRGGNIEGRPAGGVRVFPGTAGTCRATVRNPGALRGRLGAGVVAYVPRYGAYVTLSRAPRETALFPVHCCHSSLPGRYASAAYTPVCGGTTGNMPRIPGGGVPGMLRYVAGRPRRSSSVRCFGMVRTGSLQGRPAGRLALSRDGTV